MKSKTSVENKESAEIVETKESAETGTKETTKLEEKKKEKKKKKSSTKSKKLNADDVGKRVTVEGYSCQGTIRFVGEMEETGALRCGVELDEAEGKNNGTMMVVFICLTYIEYEVKFFVLQVHQYFKCKKKHGVFVGLSKVAILDAGKTDVVKESAGSYEGMSRLQLVKLCRDRYLDHKAVSKDVEALKQLLIAADS